MKIDAIQNGVVIDHITAGRGMRLYELLELEQLDCSVAIIKNVSSRKLGKKDIIKIDAAVELDMDLVSFVCPKATVCIIRDEKVIEKKEISLPQTLTDILVCKNPRCITTTEQGIHQIFRLHSPDSGEYRCIYCDTKAK